MLKVENLSKWFGGLRAVDGCSFTVRPGTITGLIGPNGAGKTTVFNLLTGFLRPDAGKVLLEGEDITALPPHRVFHKGIARTFQIPREFKEMTVIENLMLVPPGQWGERLFDPFLRPWQVARQEREIGKQASEVLEFLGLSKLRDEPAGSLSGGNQQKVLLARWLHRQAGVIIFDEPTRGIDVGARHEIYQLMNSLVAKGCAIIMVTSELPEALGMSDRILVMHEGRLTGEVEDVTGATQEDLMALAIGRDSAA